MKQGFTLIELIVVIAIASILSLFAYESITNFQYQSQVEASTQELLSTLRDAQSRSRSGQILPGETAGTFTTDGLPIYGVVLNGHSYSLIREATFQFPPSTPTPTPMPHLIDSALTVNLATVNIMFSRITGLPVPNTNVQIKINRSTNTVERIINIDASGLIYSN